MKHPSDEETRAHALRMADLIAEFYARVGPENEAFLGVEDNAEYAATLEREREFIANAETAKLEEIAATRSAQILGLSGGVAAAVHELNRRAGVQ